MTKKERRLQSMLNYFEVDLGGKRDEKMSKKELTSFLDKFNQILDFHILQEILKKLKEKRDSGEKDEFEDEDEDYDPMIQPKKNNSENFDFNSLSNKKSEHLNDPIDGDINKFLKWLTLLLYSGDHSVIITEDKNGINIRLIKINKGKK